MRELRIRERDTVAEPRVCGEEGRGELHKKRPEKSVLAGLLRPKHDAPKKPDLLSQLHGTSCIRGVYSKCDMIIFMSLHRPPFPLIFC